MDCCIHVHSKAYWTFPQNYQSSGTLGYCAILHPAFTHMHRYRQLYIIYVVRVFSFVMLHIIHSYLPVKITGHHVRDCINT